MRFLSLLLVAAIAACQPSGDMGSPQSPSSTPTFPATITPPVNGENLDATALNVNVETPLQNGVEAARLLLRGGGTRRRVSCSSSSSMDVFPLGAVVATVGGTTWTVVSHLTTTNIDPATLAGALGPSTRYYVYVSISAGSLAFSVSTTAPDAGLFYKTGDTNYFFVSTFITDGANAVVPYTQSDLSFTYGNDGSGGYPNSTIALSAGSAVVSTVVPLGVSVPTGAKTAILLGQINVTSAGRYADIVDFNNGETYGRCVDAGTVGGLCNVVMSLASSNSVRYIVSNAASQLTIAVQGFSF